MRHVFQASDTGQLQLNCTKGLWKLVYNMHLNQLFQLRGKQAGDLIHQLCQSVISCGLLKDSANSLLFWPVTSYRAQQALMAKQIPQAKRYKCWQLAFRLVSLERVGAEETRGCEQCLLHFLSGVSYIINITRLIEFLLCARQCSRH